MQPMRSFLFSPANHPRRVEKVFSVDADAVILDLEDAVAIAHKPAARAMAVAALQRPRQCLGYVRVNAMETEFCWGDLAGVVQPGVDGIVLPKVESASGLLAVDWAVGQLERERGLPKGAIDIMPIIETARGIADLDGILRAGSRIRRVAFGAGDFTLDVKMVWSRGESEFAHARAAVVTSSRAAGLEAPIDTVWADLNDQEALEASTRTALGFGFQGKMCIHPKQIPVVNQVFTPAADEVDFARRVVAAFAEAEAAGSAAFQLDGKFIDYPIVYRAERVLKTVAAIEARGRPEQAAE